MRARVSARVKPLQGSAGHKAVVGVVEYRLRPHKVHQTVKALSGKTFEECVLLPACAHTVDNITALIVLVQHAIHRIHIILQVGIHGNRHVTAVLCRHKSRQQRILMAPVSGQIHP